MHYYTEINSYSHGLHYASTCTCTILNKTKRIKSSLDLKILPKEERKEKTHLNGTNKNRFVMKVDFTAEGETNMNVDHRKAELDG